MTIESLFTRSTIERVLALTILLGTLTLVVMVLGTLYLAVLIVKTIVDCVLEIVRTIAEVLTIGGPFVRLLFVFLLLFLLWKAAPHILAYIRRELARVAPLFTRQETTQENEDKQERVIYGSVADQQTQDQGQSAPAEDQAPQNTHTNSLFALTEEENGTFQPPHREQSMAVSTATSRRVQLRSYIRSLIPTILR